MAEGTLQGQWAPKGLGLCRTAALSPAHGWPQTHSAPEPQPAGARSHIPPGPLQGLLLGEGDPAPVTRVLVTAKRFLRLRSEGLCDGAGL